jgi:hypothetical protein
MIERIAQRIDNAALKSRVLIVTLSDGAENASRSYNLPGLRKAIEYRQKVCGWRFNLISPHAATVAFSLGIPRTNTLRWQADPVAVAALLERVSRSISGWGDKSFALKLRA